MLMVNRPLDHLEVATGSVPSCREFAVEYVGMTFLGVTIFDRQIRLQYHVRFND